MELKIKVFDLLRVGAIAGLLWIGTLQFNHLAAWYNNEQCDEADEYVRSYEVCTKAEPNSAFCAVSVKDISDYRVARYRLMTETCKMHEQPY